MQQVISFIQQDLYFFPENQLFKNTMIDYAHRKEGKGTLPARDVLRGLDIIIIKTYKSNLV
jgi:hypothetical protein